MRNHNHREAPWEEYHRIVDELLASYDVPTAEELEDRRRALLGA